MARYGVDGLRHAGRPRCCRARCEKEVAKGTSHRASDKLLVVTDGSTYFSRSGIRERT
jgi:hypothetical protein